MSGGMRVCVNLCLDIECYIDIYIFMYDVRVVWIWFFVFIYWQYNAHVF